MKDKKNMKNGFLKKGLVLCLVGAIAFGMMACGSSNKKKDSTQAKVKTESNKEQGSIGKTDIAQPKSSVGTKKQDNKADAEQPKNSVGTKNQDNKTDAEQPKSSVGTKNQDKKADAEQPQTKAGTQKEKDTNTKKDTKDTQTNKAKEGSSSKK